MAEHFIRSRNEAINRFFSSEIIAVAGVSRSEKKFGSRAYRVLKEKGFMVVPIHRELETFDGDRCFRSLKDLPSQAASLYICVSPRTALDLVSRVAETGIKNIWFQLGSKSAEAIDKAQELSLNVVKDKCIIMYAEPVTGIHAFHKYLADIFGRL
jgi:predicted CoA-binding protein